MFPYGLYCFNARKAVRGGDSSVAKELVVAPLQFSAAAATLALYAANHPYALTV